MREILFRGKRIDNGEWVYGYYIRANDHWHKYGVHNDWIATDIVQNGGYCNVRGRYAVDPSTVGQYTGLTDKNGKKIFEGDIIHAVFKSNYIGVPDKCFGDGVVEYRGSYYENAAYRMNMIGEAGYRIFSSSLEVKIIGNIHDNPELLEVSGDE